MKLRLPNKLIAALMSAMSAAVFTTLASGNSAAAATIADTAGSSLGNIMNAGDSISHGVGSPSYRYFLFKNLVDNGIGNTVVGPCVGNYNSNEYTGKQYGNATFSNVRAAVYGARSFEISNTPQELHANPSRNPDAKGDYKWTTGNVGAAYANSYINNWLGLSNINRVGGTYSGDTYHVDTFMMLIGTNDMLTDIGTGFTTPEKLNDALRAMLGATYVDNGDGTHSFTFSTAEQEQTSEASLVKTWRAVKTANANANVVYMGVPTLGVSHAAAQKGVLNNVNLYNEALKLWCENHGVTYVQSDEGLRDVTNAAGAGVFTMFQPPNDQCHLSYQGDLIFGGNIAKAMGYAGRTVGLARSSAAEANGATWTTAAETSYTLGSGSQTVASDIFSVLNGYTVDFGAVFGDGSDNGWAAQSNALSVTIGDGTRTGTLSLSEGYVMWNNSTILYSKDNHLASDNLRVAYVNEGVNESDGVAAGYYVWLGDMLIGEGLSAGSGSLNGITLSANGGTGTVSNLTWTNTAYAPTTTLYSNAAAGFHLTQVAVRESYDSDAKHLENVSFAGITPVTTGQFATGINTASGAISVVRTGSATDAWVGAVGAAHTGNVSINFHEFSSSGSIITDVSNTLTEGSISVVLDGGTSITGKGTFGNSGNQTSFFGVYEGAVGGALQLEINDATLGGGIQMGHIARNNVTSGTISGGTKLIINKGAVIGGDVFGGGSARGTIESGTSITVTGGTVNGSIYGGNREYGTIEGGTNILITGGRITGSVNGGSLGDSGSLSGSTNVTVEGVTPFIGRTITADNVTLRSIADSGFEDGFDKYSNAITATEKLTLDAYTANHVASPITTKKVLATGNTRTTISNLTLTACDITAEAGSALTLEGVLSLGNTATYSGNISVADDITFSMSNEVAASLASAGYSSGASGYRTLGTASLLTSSDGSRLTVGNTGTYLGTGALEGATFKYDSDTGTLSATSARVLGTTYYVNSAVTYDHGTEAYGANAFVIGNGGNLTLARDLKDGVTVAGAEGASSATVTVGNGVTLTKSSVTGTLNSYAVNEGGVYSYGNYNNTNDAARLDFRTSLTGAGTMQVKFTNSGHGGAYVMTGEGFTGTLDLSGKVHLQNLNTNTANAAVKYYIHDADIWWGNANITVAHDITFGGDIQYRPEGDTVFSGTLADDGSANFNWRLGGSPDNGSQKNKTVTLTNAGAASLSKVTLVNDNLTLEQTATGANKTRLFTGNIDVKDGRTLTLTPENTGNKADKNAAALFDGAVTLSGTGAADTSVAKVKFSDGSVYFKDGIHVAQNGFGLMEMDWEKQQHLEYLTGENATLTLSRKSTTWSNAKGGYFHLYSEGSFSGTIKLANAADNGVGGLVLHAGAGNALAGTELDFSGSTNKALVAFLSGDATYSDVNVLTNTEFGNGTVAGLKGTNGIVKAGTLTINLSSDNTYGGDLTASKLVLTGTGSQTISTTGLTIDGKRLVDTNGTGEAGESNGFTRIFKGETVTATNGAHLILGGNVNFNDSGFNGGIIDSGLGYLEVTGNVQINTYGATTWQLHDHTLKVGGNLWMTNKQTMAAVGGALTVGGKVLLGHDQNGGNYHGHLSLQSGSTFSAQGIGLYGNKNSVDIGDSTVTFTGETVLSQVKGTAADNSVTLTNDTLTSTTSAWNLTAITGTTVTVAGDTKLNIATGKDITIGSATVSGSLTHLEDSAGTLNLAGDTLNDVTLSGGAFALSGASTINGTLNIDHGSLALGGTATIGLGTDMNRFELKGTGEGGTGEATYSGQNTYAGSGFLQGDSATYYLIKQGEGAEITGAFTSVTKADNISYNDSDYTFTVAGQDSTTYYVNGNFAYNDTEMGSATYLNIAEGKNLSAIATAPANAKQLIGTGSYVLQTNSQTLGDNMSLGADWRGRVVVSGNITNFNLSNLGTAQSSIEIKGLHGWFDSHTVNANVIIGEGGLDFNNGLNNTTLTFNGNLSGTGDIIRSTSASANVGVAFKGDVSEYTGNILHNRATNTTFTVTFADKANVINANLKTAQYAYGTLSINFNAADTVVNGVVDNTVGFRDNSGNYNHKVNVTATQDVTFNNTVKVNSLSAAGHNIVLGSHTMEDGTVTHGDLTVTVPDVQTQTQMRSLTMLEGTHASFNGKLMASSVTLSGAGTTLALGNIDHTITDLVINDGAVATANGPQNDWGFNHGITHINGGGKLELAGNNSMGSGSTGAYKIILEGAAGKTATLQLGGNNMLSHGIEMAGYTQIIGDDNGNGLLETNLYAQGADGATISVSGTNNTIAAKIAQRKAITLDVHGAGSTLLVTGAVQDRTGGNYREALVKTGEGAVTFNNDADVFKGYKQQAGTTVISSAATFNANPVEISGGLFEVNAAGKAVALNSNVTVTGGAFTLTNGNITLNNANTFTATNSVVTINGGTFTTGTNGLTIGSGAVLNLAATSGSQAGSTSFLHGSVTVQNGGQLVLTGHDATGYNGGDNALQKITVQEGGQLLLGFNDSNETYVGTLILDGTLAMQQGHSGSRVDLFSKNGHNAKIQVSDGAHGVVTAGVTLKLREDNAEFAVGEGGTLTVNGGFIKGENGNNTFRKTGLGEMIINTSLDNGNGVNGISLEAGTLTLNGESNKMGALNIRAGALKTFGGEINGLTMSGGSITNNGTLTIGGAAVLTNMTALGEAVSGFSDGANGFSTTSNNYQLVTNTGVGTVASTVTSWSVNGATPTTATLAADGVLTATDKAADGIYHVNQGMSYDGTTATADMGAATLFEVEAGVQMNADGGLLAGRDVKLAEGAILGSLSGEYNFNNNQIGSLTLTGTTAWVDVSNSNFALKGTSGSTLTLNGGKLSVKGAARFGLFNTTVDAGTISVTNDGNVVSYVQVGYGSSKNSEVQAAGTLFEFAGGQLVIGGGSIAGFKGLTMSDENASGAIFGDGGATGGNIKLALDGETYTYRGSIADSINLITTGAGTQNFELSGSANIGKVKTEAGNMAFSGIAATVASGVELADGTSVTFGNGATITGATLAGTASLNFTGGTSTLTGAIAAANTSTVALSNSAALTIKDAADKTLPNVTLNGGTMYFFGQGAGHTYTLNSVAVTGANNTIATAIDNTAFHAKVNIENLSSAGDGAELNLTHNAKVDVPSVFDINGGEDGAFNGVLHLQQNQSARHNAGRHVAMNIKDADVLSNAVISMESVAMEDNSVSRVGLGIAVDGATVKGISTDNSTAEKVIFSGSAATNSRNYDGDGTSRTLVINTAGGEYTANATVKSNLNIAKTGEGTQAFTGDMSAFNGNLSVQEGTLHIAASNATTNAHHVEVAADALLKLKAGASLNVNELVLGNSMALAAEGGSTRETPDPVVMSDGEVNAHITVTGTQEEHGTLAVGTGGTDVRGIDLTVSGHVDYDAIPGNVLNLNGGNLTLSTLQGDAGQPSIELSHAFLDYIDAHCGAALFTGISGLTINGVSYEPGELLIGDLNAGTVFGIKDGGSLSASQYSIVFRADNNGTGTLFVTPEPATAALSLLALAGLAARRKRK